MCNNISSNLSTHNYRSNNNNKNKKLKNGHNFIYSINNNNNKYICYSPNNSENKRWTNIYEKKKIISAFLNNKEAKDIFGEENELFDNIKKNKKMETLLSNISTKNKTEEINYSNRTDDSYLSSQKKNKLFCLNNKKQPNKRKFSYINGDIRFDLNLKDKKDNKINKKDILENNNKENEKILQKKIHLNIKQKQYYNNRKFHSIILKNKTNDIINKKSATIKKNKKQ